MANHLPPREEISHYECVHASYTRSNRGPTSDAVIVKELIHCKDGRVIPNLRILENYERSFGVTLDAYQTHKDKKPWEELRKVRRFKCKQHELYDKASRALGRGSRGGSLRQLARSPYLYGVDIETPVLVKRGYRDRFPSDPTPASVAVYDIEWSMVSPEEEIVLSSLTFKKKAILTILRSFTKGDPNFVDNVRKKIDLYLGEVIKARGLDVEIRIADHPAQCVIYPFERAHEWKPDYITTWNITADIPKSVSTLQEAGYNPSDIFCDPSIPPKYRNFEYIPGKTHKSKGGFDDTDDDDDTFDSMGDSSEAEADKGDGKVPINVHDQWHYCENQASFILSDSMLLYKRIRTASPNDASYSLDYILKKHGLGGKLKFTEADGYEKGEWHAFMQVNYPEEYCVYNLWDSISVEMLDEKTGDIAQSLQALLKCSEYKNYNSQPKMIADDLHFFGLKRGNIIGSTSDDMVTELDRLSPGLRNWIVTLPAYMMAEEGGTFAFDMPNHRTKAYTHVAD